MRIAIVDDLAAERTLLKGRLEWQLQRRNVQADILEYESGEIFLEAARKAPFTAAFLNRFSDFRITSSVIFHKRFLEGEIRTFELADMNNRIFHA